MEQKSLFDLNELIQFRQRHFVLQLHRHTMHKNPEIGFKEINTQKAIEEFLLKKGINNDQIKKIALTGLVVDIKGKGPVDGVNKVIACRADIDALAMTEENNDLPYRSTIKAAHMCGHDGHTTSLLGFTCLLLENLQYIPLNKAVRLMFQPSEEGPASGALKMIEDGCLDGVDEVYGFHNWPTHTVGHCMVKPGPMMSEVSIIKLTIFGRGGHGILVINLFYLASTPEKCVDPLQIASTGFISGTVRSFENGLSGELKQGFIQILEKLKEQFDYKYDLDWNITFPMVDNSEKQSLIVEELGKQFFGAEKTGVLGLVPVKASEDFSFYLQKVPGCFFFLGSARENETTMLHNSNFNFNDDLLEKASKFWLKLVLNRLNTD